MRSLSILSESSKAQIMSSSSDITDLRQLPLLYKFPGEVCNMNYEMTLNSEIQVMQMVRKLTLYELFQVYRCFWVLQGL